MSGRRSAVIGLLLVAIAGCRSAPQITGTYDLIGANGARLPVRAGWVPQASSELTGGSLTLNPDGTYRQRLVFLVHSQARGDYADSSVHVGTYQLRMSTVRMHTPGGDQSAQLAGPMLQLSLGAWTYVFRKAGP